MARSIPKQAHTQADELRDLLESSYKTAVNIRGKGPETARELLAHLDRIDALFPQLEARGVDLRAERGRWQEVQGAVRRHGDELRGELAPLGGLKSLRQELPQSPPPERWWWWLDVRAHRQLRRRISMIVATVAGILLLIWGGLWAFDKLFPVDPNIAAAHEHKSSADELIRQGRLQDAALELEAAYRAMPDDPEIISLLAAIYDVTGQQERSLDLTAKLRQQEPPGMALADLAQSYLLVGDWEKAGILANEAIKAAPEIPQGYLVAGMVYEASGDVHAAMDAYQKAADAANAAKDYQTEAFAKIRLATLLQKPQRPQSPALLTPGPGG